MDEKKNQGEGDKDAARRYNQRAQAYVERGDVPRAAKDARDAVEGPEGPLLAEAEARGKRPARMSVFERVESLVGRLRTAVSRRRRH